MRSIPLALVLALVCGCSAGNTTDVDISALGLPGATISDGDTSATIGASGRARFPTRRLSTRSSLFGTEIIAVDGETPLQLDVSLGDHSVSLMPFCVPPMGPGEPIDGIELLLRRDVATGNCMLIALSTRRGFDTFRGEYTPERFDDAPCGPWQ
jgi:hypothetical protein